MRRGYDLALASALKTDRATLFSGYAKIAPDVAPVLDPRRISVSSEEHLRRRANAVAELLNGDKLREFAAFGERILSGSGTS
jgi:hypothetical protein